MTISQLPQANMLKVLSAIPTIENTGYKDPFDVAKALGVRVVFTRIRCVPAFYQRDKLSGIATIFIERTKNPFVRKILCWHELGHILTDDSTINLFNHKSNAIDEFTANSIAIHFMNGLINDNYYDEDTKIENINKYISLKVAANGRNNFNFDKIPLNDSFWDMID